MKQRTIARLNPALILYLYTLAKATEGINQAMKLFCHQRRDRQPNFGNELNHWLWPKLCPDLFNTNDSTAFVGMGTMLNNQLSERLQPNQSVSIFSTGVGYEQPIKQIPSNWTIHCLRGPFSAKWLGLPEQKAITDGGMLVAQILKPANDRNGCSFMPHIGSAIAAAESWQQICQKANVQYIDPRWSVDSILAVINSSDRLLCESMYGVIAADALRVPWTPLTTSPRIYAFKWQDWCASMGLPYLPHRLPPLANYTRWSQDVRSSALAAKHWSRAGLEDTKTTLQYALFQDEIAIVERLKSIVQQPSYLSTEKTFEAKLDALQECLNNVNRFTLPERLVATVRSC